MKKKIKIFLSKEKLEPSDLFEFETSYNIILPANYKNFIMKYNGGVIENVLPLETLNSIKYGKFTIEKFIHIHQELEQNLPLGYLPFANDCADNPITICLIPGVDYGKILLFYFDTDEGPEVLANSLEELFGVTNIDNF
jgi:SMI1-KNR4 cell-wall